MTREDFTTRSKSSVLHGGQVPSSDPYSFAFPPIDSTVPLHLHALIMSEHVDVNTLCGIESKNVVEALPKCFGFNNNNNNKLQLQCLGRPQFIQKTIQFLRRITA
jgi:hypothetical protein